MRLRHMRRWIQASYSYYIVGFIRFHGERHPRELKIDEIRTYLSYLVIEKGVAASIQNVALSATRYPALRVPATDILAARRQASRRSSVDFSGTYYVVSSPDFDGGHLGLNKGANVTLRQSGEFVKGEYEIETQCGVINGGVHSDFIEFDFNGADEMEEAFGDGEAMLEGDRLTFVLRYYRGDEFTFHCERGE